MSEGRLTQDDSIPGRPADRRIATGGDEGQGEWGSGYVVVLGVGTCGRNDC